MRRQGYKGIVSMRFRLCCVKLHCYIMSTILPTCAFVAR
jgi:hypothetical protein